MQIKQKKNRKTREHEVLMGLVDLYLTLGKPIGSNTLRDSGFESLSSATIRNYFARLETEGYLKQHHASGGRVPTDRAYRIYAGEMLENSGVGKDDDAFLSSLLKRKTKEISRYMQESVEAISELTGCSAFIAAPRFDQDFIVKIKLIQIDDTRILCAIVTDFSLVHTEILYLPKGLDNVSIPKIEDYFQFRLTGLKRPTLSEGEEMFAKQSYNEIVLRHFVSYTNMQFEDVFKGGFAKLLQHPEFHDPTILSNTLALFENKETIRQVLKKCFESQSIKYWIGEDLQGMLSPPYYCSIIAIPYRINNVIVGAIAVLGPDRLPYKKIFGILKKASDYLSENLTESMYKYKLNYRQPKSNALDVKKQGSGVLGLSHQPLIENKDE